MWPRIVFLTFLSILLLPTSAHALTVSSPSNTSYLSDPALTITNAANDNLTYSLDGGANRTCVQVGTACALWGGGVLSRWVPESGDAYTEADGWATSGFLSTGANSTLRKEGQNATNWTMPGAGATSNPNYGIGINTSFQGIERIGLWIYWEANSSVASQQEINITQFLLVNVITDADFRYLKNYTLVANTWVQIESANISAWTATGNTDITNIQSVWLSLKRNITTVTGGNILIDGWKGYGKNLTQGAHNITAFNTTSSATTYFTIGQDTTPPLITVLSPSNTTYYANNSVWTNITASETVGQPVQVELNGTYNYTMTNDAGVFKYLLANLSNGAHRVKFFVNDTAGNMNDTVLVYFTVSLDPNPPNITHLSPANLTRIENRNFSVQVNASDNVGLDTLVVDFGGVNVTKNAGLVNGSNNITLTGLNDGNVTYYVVANDSAGNTNATPKYIVTIDTKNATLTLIQVSGINDKAATVTFTADRQVNTTITLGTASGVYTTNTSNSTIGTSQTVALTGLSANTLYFFRVYTWNLASNLTDSGQRNFTTATITQSGGGGGGGGGGLVTPITPEVIVAAIKEAVANFTAPKASILYITQDTTACWVHKISEILPPDSIDPYDPCFPPQLYGGAYVEVGALAYFTNGSVLSYTWWVSDPGLKVQPPKSTLTVPLGEGVYPIGVDIATTTGQVYSLQRAVTVVPGLPPVKAGGAVVGEAVSNTGRASFSVVGGLLGGMGGAASSGVGAASSDDWSKVVWTNGKAVITKGQLALLLFGGLGYVYFSGRGDKRRR